MVFIPDDPQHKNEIEELLKMIINELKIQTEMLKIITDVDVSIDDIEGV